MTYHCPRHGIHNKQAVVGTMAQSSFDCEAGSANSVQALFIVASGVFHVVHNAST
jgi:hypothetical protein